MLSSEGIILLDARIAGQAARVAFKKLDPRSLIKNPVMFVVEVVAILATLGFLRDLATGGAEVWLVGQIAAWLWFTVLFANFAEAVAEGRGRARADSLRATHQETEVKRLASPDGRNPPVKAAGQAAAGRG